MSEKFDTVKFYKKQIQYEFTDWLNHGPKVSYPFDSRRENQWETNFNSDIHFLTRTSQALTIIKEIYNRIKSHTPSPITEAYLDLIKPRPVDLQNLPYLRFDFRIRCDRPTRPDTIRRVTIGSSRTLDHQINGFIVASPMAVFTEEDDLEAVVIKAIMTAPSVARYTPVVWHPQPISLD